MASLLLSTDAERILAEALVLSPVERAAVAQDDESVDGHAEPPAGDAVAWIGRHVRRRQRRVVHGHVGGGLADDRRVVAGDHVGGGAAEDGVGAVGITEVHVMPLGGDPVDFVDAVGRYVVPRLTDLG